MAERSLAEEEKTARRRRNPRERTVMDSYERKGWEIITRGFPCFLARRPGQPVRLVWVERKGFIDPRKNGLRESHRKMHSIFLSIFGGDPLGHLHIEDPENPQP